MNIIIRNEGNSPIYEQIVTQIKNAILAEELSEGEALPSMRLLAKELRISLITTKRAYEELEREGFVVDVYKRQLYSRSEKARFFGRIGPKALLGMVRRYLISNHSLCHGGKFFCTLDYWTALCRERGGLPGHADGAARFREGLYDGLATRSCCAGGVGTGTHVHQRIDEERIVAVSHGGGDERLWMGIVAGRVSDRCEPGESRTRPLFRA